MNVIYKEVSFTRENINDLNVGIILFRSYYDFTVQLLIARNLLTCNDYIIYNSGVTYKEEFSSVT